MAINPIDITNEQEVLGAITHTDLRIFFRDAEAREKFAECLASATHDDAANLEESERYALDCPPSVIKGCKTCCDELSELPDTVVEEPPVTT